MTTRRGRKQGKRGGHAGPPALPALSRVPAPSAVPGLDGLPGLDAVRARRRGLGRVSPGRLPWSLRLVILTVATTLITVFTGGVAAALVRARRTAPPDPAERPPRVDDPLR